MVKRKIFAISLTTIFIFLSGCVDKAFEPVTDSLEENYSRSWNF